MNLIMVFLTIKNVTPITNDENFVRYDKTIFLNSLNSMRREKYQIFYIT